MAQQRTSTALPLRARLARFAARKSAWTLSRLTTAGKLVLLGYGVTIIFVVDTRATLNYQLFGLCIALLFFAVVLGLARRGSFGVRRILPRHATAGVPLRYVVRLTNTGDREARSLELAEDIAWPDNASPTRRVRSVSTPVDALAPGQSRSVAMQLLPVSRGLLRFDGAMVGLVDPLGLYKGLLHIPAPETLVVLPRTYPAPPLDLRAGRRYQPRGQRTTIASGDSQEFAGLRDYRPGDPVRHIHWPSFARFGEPKVKEFQDEYLTRLALVLDTFPYPPPSQWAEAAGEDARQNAPDGSAKRSTAAAIHEEQFEAAVSVAASLAVARRQQDTVLDLLFVADEARQVSAERGRGDEQALLEALAAVEPCLDKPMDVLERVVLNHAPFVGGVILVLLAWDVRRRQLVDRLRAAGLEVRAILAADPPSAAMRSLPQPDGIIRPQRLEEDIAAL
ncbi:DUF58 domain-containing protein [Oceanidesulfovibrio marinus]|nr:DUF58 domain-containing protein [Oceanidesulfovibrio marinus]